MTSSIEVVIVGSVALDTIETSRDKGADLLGGSVSYACAAASFFATTGMVGIVGSDFPAEYVDTYRHFGIDLAGLTSGDGRTFRWSGVYEKDMINRRTLSTELNVFETFNPSLPSPYVDAPFVLLGNISPELQLNVLSQARKPRFVVADTMDLWINIARDPLMELLSRVDMLMLNDAEARLLTGEYNLMKCASTILDMGPDHVVLKKGEHGAILFSKDGISIVPAFPVAMLHDPTGAGDSFAGGFLGALAEGGGIDSPALRRALFYGSVVASFGVESFSLDRLAKLERADIDKRFRALTEMVSVSD